MLRLINILEIKIYVKVETIFLNQNYLSKWLHLKLVGLRIFSKNKLVTVRPSLTQIYEVRTMFRDEFIDADHIPTHNFLLLKSHIQHNILT